MSNDSWIVCIHCDRCQQRDEPHWLDSFSLQLVIILIDRNVWVNSTDQKISCFISSAQALLLSIYGKLLQPIRCSFEQLSLESHVHDRIKTAPASKLPNKLDKNEQPSYLWLVFRESGLKEKIKLYLNSACVVRFGLPWLLYSSNLCITLATCMPRRRWDSIKRIFYRHFIHV